jgi:deoxyribodipyrimidine photo-lyase
MQSPVSIVWFRNDLRLADQLALTKAASRGRVLPVFVLDDAADGGWRPGGAARWWLHHSLEALDVSLRQRGLRLHVARGSADAILPQLARETGADAVFWSRHYTSYEQRAELAVSRRLAAAGVTGEACDGFLLHDPATIQTGSGAYYSVFTPFWKNLSRHLRVDAPLPVPSLRGLENPPEGLSVSELGLLPRIPWDSGFGPVWAPGETTAHARLATFAAGAAATYGDTRNTPGIDGTSMLSPHLRFGELSPRQIWRAVAGSAPVTPYTGAAEGVEVYLREIGWREFAWHVLTHQPQTLELPLRSKWQQFHWETDPAMLAAWQRGQTGYPMVDAGMRQLWATGWMHNRVRMIVASFLTKHLLQHWYEGARWFWDTLVDADAGNNTMGWQWAGGCGADAQPFFRVFHPVTQGEKFDAAGDYVRHWVPELAALPSKYIHAPFQAPPFELLAAGVKLGETYPFPVVEHAWARKRAIDRAAQLGLMDPGTTLREV